MKRRVGEEKRFAKHRMSEEFHPGGVRTPITPSERDRLKTRLKNGPIIKEDGH